MRSLTVKSAVSLLLVASTGCTTKGLFELLNKERVDIATETRAFDELVAKEVRMTWREAEKRLIEHGPSMRQARLSLEEASRKRERQWREWIPRPSIYVSFQKEINEIGDLSREDLAGSIYAPLSIPNPVAAKSRAYSYALSELQARDSLELMKRRQIILLYNMFYEWEEMEREADRSQGRDLVGAMDAIELAISNKQMDHLMEERRAMLQIRFSRLLNMPHARVVPVTSSAPKIDYERKLSSLKPGENYGQLGVHMFSYQIVSAVLRSRGIKVNQWRVPSMNVSVPALYNSEREADFIDSTDQIRLFSSWGKTFDMTGREAEAIEKAEEYVAFVRDNLKIQIMSEQAQWSRLKKKYALLLIKRDLVRARLKKMISENEGDAEADVRDVMSMIKELDDIEKRKMSLDTEVWKWDDRVWK